MTDLPAALVSTEWLAAHLSAPDVKPVDGTYFLPNVPRDAAAEFRDRHIPGAVRFDIDAIKDLSNPLPHMLPSPAYFAEAVGKLGLGSDDLIVAYDALGLMSAARIWWMFRVFGHEKVAVLDGGLPKWLAEGRPTESGDATPAPAPFRAQFHAERATDSGGVTRALKAGEQVLDVRSRGRFAGTEAELRPGVRSGHMPGARNLPYNDLLNKDGTMLGEAAIAERFGGAGIDLAQPVITSCGSGVTACVAALALHRIGGKAIIYDGSWTEWGSRQDLPVVTG